MDRSFWDVGDQAARSWYRTRNMISRGAVVMVDDTNPAQLHQINAHSGIGEIRDQVQRVGMFGHGSVPLPGASAMISWQGGNRGFGTVIGIEDGRYRPKNYKGGESHFTMVDGAKADGTGGTLRKLSEGLLGWIHVLYGKTISVGDADAVTINIGTTAKSVTLNFGSSNAAVNIIGATGDVKVNGVSLVNHTHGGVMTGSGNTSPPNQSWGGSPETD